MIKNVFLIIESCGAGEIDVGNGICTNDSEMAASLKSFMDENDHDETGILGLPQRVTRRFPMGQASDAFKGPGTCLHQTISTIFTIKKQ